MKKVIIFHSKHGATQEYAEWLAEATAGESVPLAKAKKLDLSAYDVVAFGCPYIAGRLKIAGFVKDRAPQLAGKRVAFFAVGITPPDSPDVSKGYDAALPEEVRAGMRFFFLPGRLTTAKLGFLERQMIKMARAEDTDRVDRAAIGPLADFLNG
jgi:menaquinone-dependent protoporphyrinogen IX oxidase